MADATYQPLVYRQQGSTKLVVASGGILDIESGGALQIAGVAITASAAELNAAAGSAVSSSELQMLDGCIPGTAVAGKAVVCATTKKHVDILAMTELNVGAGTSVGIAITSGDINLIDGLTAGTLVASKAVTVGAAKQVNEICISSLFLGATTGGVEITSGDATLIDGLTAGTLLASKAVTVGAAKQVNEICISNLFVGATTAGVEITSGDANFIDGLTAGTVTASKAVVAGAAKQINEICVSNLFSGATTGGVELTSNDLNLIDGLTAGTLTASKAVVAGAAKQINELCVTDLFLGATTGGVDITSGDANLIDGLTPGTLVASKAVTVGAAKQVNELCISSLFLGATTAGVEITSGDADLIDGITKGTVAAGKAVVCASTKMHVNSLAMTNFYLGAGSSVGYELTSDSFLTTAEGTLITGITEGTVTGGKAVVVDTSKKVDILALGSLCIGTNTSSSFLVSATVNELNLNDDQLASITWALTSEALDVITITATMLDGAGTALTRCQPVLLSMLADTCGAAFASPSTVSGAITTGAFGNLREILCNRLYQGIASTSGLLTITWTDTSSAVPWYPGIILPNGKWSIGAQVECTS